MDSVGLGALKHMPLSEEAKAWAESALVKRNFIHGLRLLMGDGADEAKVQARADFLTHALKCAMVAGPARLTKPSYTLMPPPPASSSSSSAAAAAPPVVSFEESELDYVPQGDELEEEVDPSALFAALLDPVDVRGALAKIGLPVLWEGGAGKHGVSAGEQQAFIADLPRLVDSVLSHLQARSAAFASYDPRAGRGRTCISIPRAALAALNQSLDEALRPITPGAVVMQSNVAAGAECFAFNRAEAEISPEQYQRILTQFSPEPLLREAARRHALQHPPADAAAAAAADGGGGGGEQQQQQQQQQQQRPFIMNLSGMTWHGPVSAAVGPAYGTEPIFSSASVLATTTASSLSHSGKPMAAFQLLIAPPRYALSDAKPMGYKDWNEFGLKVNSWKDRGTVFMSMYVERTSYSPPPPPLLPGHRVLGLTPPSHSHPSLSLTHPPLQPQRHVHGQDQHHGHVQEVQPPHL